MDWPTIHGSSGYAVGEQQPHVAGHDEGDTRWIEPRVDSQAEHVAPEGQRHVEVAASRQRDLTDRTDCSHFYMEKLVPQPQEATAFGFRI